MDRYRCEHGVRILNKNPDCLYSLELRFKLWIGIGMRKTTDITSVECMQNE